MNSLLKRVLEPEIMESAEEALLFDTMDHTDVNRVFVDDLLLCCPEPCDVLDVGTGTAQIPVELCRRVHGCRVMAADMSCEMLDLARYNTEMNGLADRIQLDQSDAKQMPYQDGMFDLVMSNSIVHHIEDPSVVLSEVIRVTANGGSVFFRDLLRPMDRESLENIVQQYAQGANEQQQHLFRNSLHAALSLPEIRSIVEALGFAAESVQATTDRHWTWIVHKPAVEAE